MAISMSLVDSAEEKASVRVPIIASLSPAAIGDLVNAVPGEVSLPR
jgi:hypothetical protein